MDKKMIIKYLLISILIITIAFFFIFKPFTILFFHEDVFRHIFFSVERVIIGFSIASILGIGLAFILGSVNKKRSFLRYILELLRPIPPIARIPLAIIRFGLGDQSAYFIVFIGSFFPIFTNTYFGIRSFPSIYSDVSKNFELNRFNFNYNVLFTYSLPYIFSGLKIGLGMGWMSLIAAELIGAQSGLGYYIQINRLLLNIDNVIFGMVLIGIIGFLLNYLLNKIEIILIKRRD